MIDLVAIVKNEAEGIEATLRSVLPFCDGYLIGDTGSTDGTQAIIARVAAELGKHGAVIAIPFVDFAQARNRVLDEHFAWRDEPLAPDALTLMIDADDRLVGGDFVRNELPEIDAKFGHHGDGFFITRKLGEMTWEIPLLLRARSRLRYTGKVHEAIALERGVKLPKGAVVVEKHAGPSSRAKSLARWEQELELLAGERKTDTRSAFYYAQTLECLDRLAEAEVAYGERAQMVTRGWREETCVARLRPARLQALLGADPATVERTLRAALAIDPRRSEAYLELARLAYRAGDNARARRFAERAIAAPTTSVLFREPTEAPARELIAWIDQEDGASSSSTPADATPTVPSAARLRDTAGSGDVADGAAHEAP